MAHQIRAGGEPSGPSHSAPAGSLRVGRCCFPEFPGGRASHVPTSPYAACPCTPSGPRPPPAPYDPYGPI